MFDQGVNGANHLLVFAILATPHKVNNCFSQHALRLTGYEVQNWCSTLHDLDVGTLTKDNLENFILLKPLKHVLGCEVLSRLNLIAVEIHVSNDAFYSAVALLIGGQLLVFDDAFDHLSDVLQTANPLL